MSIERTTGSGVQERAETFASDLGRGVCNVFPFLCPAAVGAVYASGYGEGAADTASAGSVVTDVLEASAAPVASVAETARWTSIGIIAIVSVIVLFVAIFFFFYFRGFR